MKKLVLAAVVSSLFSGAAMADTTYNLEHGSDKETKFSFYHDIALGFSGGLEFVTNDNLKRHKETNMRIDYNFDITDAWYIQPQFELTVPSGSTSRSGGQFTINGDKVNGSQRISNTAKLGLKTGYQFDNGLYTAVRYRYEMAERKLNFNDGEKRKASIKEDNNIHRMDLTVGYVVADTMDLSANYIYKRGDSKFDAHGVSDKKTEHGKLKGNQSELELKAKFIGFDKIRPYAMYTVKGDAEIKGLGKKSVDNVFSVGVNFNF